ncbi:hypothetical protein BO83DRAFT_327454 [Aspergillus eucalypticola CBS 122712]|uniref:TLC domain-containing protein n=1 Tax=Aspergillus eucalypticola (strain CBS 122712 / IBT 29274) TaxID=1448314 RepID=A0A317UI19_ASPEC|nr:uncharacterized protein BO83DRAFT_327454 [Aspergillus eucalypticola CBS 122712]PWY61724.1 hypothetical protein BO83DRAFT_327454 [Aspergillus eucalypticola CBS 122712]
MERLSSAGCHSILSDDELENTSWFPFCVTATKLSSYSGIFLSLLFILYVFLNRFILRRFLLVYIYGEYYSSLQLSGQRLFSLRHLGVLARTISLVCIIKPAFMLVLSDSRWTDLYFRSSSITLGDMAFLSASFTSAFHIFELIFDDQLKLLLFAHHLGAIIMVQAFLPTAVNVPVTRVLELNSTIAMAKICMCWATLDAPLVIASYVIWILQRTWIRSDTGLCKLYSSGFYLAAFSTFFEASAVIYFGARHWSQLSALQVLTISCLQVLFTSAKAKVCKHLRTAYTSLLKKSC